MNSKKKSNPAKGTPQPFHGRGGSAHRFQPAVAQLKTGVSTRSTPIVKRPIAPPVYRPQPLPRVLQTKSATAQSQPAGRPPRPPVAPPIYRQQAKPVVAQAKMAGTSLVRKHPVAPPVYRPQVRSNAVQRYSQENIPELEGNGILSERENYFIPDKYGGRHIYGAISAKAPTRSTPQKKQKDYNGKKYREYKSQKFLKDCLHTAEEIGADKKLQPGKVQSKVHGKRKQGKSVPFGESDDDNIEAAEAYALDDRAAPKVGQAYVIVNKEWPGGVKYPYHAAGVVAVDGKDRVTLEVCAGSQDAKSRNTYGKYSMYTTGSGAGDKFHSHWVDSFFDEDESATVVIEPKSP